MTTVRITIPFHDKPLVLIDHNEQPFVAMRPIVDGMGMDWGSQRRKLQKRFASTVVILTTVADDGRKRAMLCLPLDPPPASAQSPATAQKTLFRFGSLQGKGSNAAFIAVFLRPHAPVLWAAGGGRPCACWLTFSPVFQPAFCRSPLCLEAQGWR